MVSHCRRALRDGRLLFRDVLEAVEEPEAIYTGKVGEHIAVKEIEKGNVVVYKELGKEDGFVITAFLTRRRKQPERRQKIWGP